MKHTIKTGPRSAVIVVDAWAGGDEIFMTIAGNTCDSSAGMNLTDEAAAALIFALESALEARQGRRDRAIQCAGDKLCSVPGACPTPVACGVAA